MMPGGKCAALAVLLASAFLLVASARMTSSNEGAVRVARALLDDDRGGRGGGGDRGDGRGDDRGGRDGRDDRDRRDDGRRYDDRRDGWLDRWLGRRLLDNEQRGGDEGRRDDDRRDGRDDRGRDDRNGGLVQDIIRDTTGRRN